MSSKVSVCCLLSLKVNWKKNYDIFHFLSYDMHSILCCITEWDPWGVPDDYECEVIENDAPVPKHVPQHRPGPLPEEFYKTLEAISKKDEPNITSGEPQIKE